MSKYELLRNKKALKWLLNEGVKAVEIDGRIFVEVESKTGKLHLELSDEEVEYRAELYDEEKEKTN